MILSVSRRTDIPNYYSEWFFNRLREEFLYVRNPMNQHQISRLDLPPEAVDCIVFWTKNPIPMIPRLSELADYHYYFQFTLTGYGRDVEPNLPDKRTFLIPAFQKLSRLVGSGRVVWRYDPILISGRYSAEYHRKAFAKIAEALNGYTHKVVISFLDFYAKTRKNMAGFKVESLSDEELARLAGELAQIAAENGMVMESCAEELDLQRFGIRHGSCIDKEMIEKITGYRLKGGKDKGQRPGCGCMESVEVGTYDTCKNGCRYCYANDNAERVRIVTERYDASSPLLCQSVGENDRITVRKMKSLREEQLSLFDIL